MSKCDEIAVSVKVSVISMHWLLEKIRERFENQVVSGMLVDSNAPVALQISDIGYCYRKLFYKYVKREPMQPLDFDAYYKMYRGMLAHDYVGRLLESTGLVFGRTDNLRVSNVEYGISGRIDAVVIDPNTSELVVVEIKPYSSVVGEEPIYPIAYEYQLQAYMLFTEVRSYKMANYGILLLYPSDEFFDVGRYKVKQIYSDDDKLSEILLICRALKECREPSEVIDLFPQPREAWECRYCGYVQKCDVVSGG